MLHELICVMGEEAWWIVLAVVMHTLLFKTAVDGKKEETLRT